MELVRDLGSSVDCRPSLKAQNAYCFDCTVLRLWNTDGIARQGCARSSIRIRSIGFAVPTTSLSVGPVDLHDRDGFSTKICRKA
jgi:hypothetical protein